MPVKSIVPIARLIPLLMLWVLVGGVVRAVDVVGCEDFDGASDSLICDAAMLGNHLDAAVTCPGCSSCGLQSCVCNYGDSETCRSADDAEHWLESVRVGYDGGFVIASTKQNDLDADRLPFRLVFNGWGQLRSTSSDFEPPTRDLNQFQLKRGRISFSGSAFNPNFDYYIQLDGRSSSGDDIRLLDYYLGWDFGHDRFGLKPGTLGFRVGKYKVPFNMARWLSGREFQFADRSVASLFFDVNRSFAWGLYGDNLEHGLPVGWEIAIFNGLVTGGAETGSTGTLDANFATSGRIHGFPVGDWGYGSLSDFESHRSLAMRCGAGFAVSTIDRSGRTEFDSLRVSDSGSTLASILPLDVQSYDVALFSIDTSMKYRGWSTTLEYYFRTIGNFRGMPLPELSDHGFWLQLGTFLVPNQFELISRWSRVQGDSGTLGATDQSTEEIAAGFAWYFHEKNHAKLVCDMSYYNGSPISATTLDLVPETNGWLFRTQLQFAF